MQKASPLIRTKLHQPMLRSALVSRPRLQEQISEGLCGPLTLITAPAGFGKTTLVAAGIAGCSMRIAWLSLDKSDNQAGRFLIYLIAALQEADPTIGKQAAKLAEATQPVSPETILTSLINDLDAAGSEIVLVLDDYQFINSQAAHEVVTFLLEHCPSTLHLVISTRSDPPLPLARLRARGLTVELRAANLRFTEAEAAQFLNDIMGLHLDARSVAVLEARTEGWIAGLQMAALSMRDRKDLIGFIEGFSGTNRYILDYLLEEVLASQPQELQCFLLCTSILERLTAPLCDAVLEDWKNGKLVGWEIGKLVPGDQSTILPISQFTSKTALEYLERANLFLVPLDDERRWYRYHQLFADLLRARLDQLYPGLAPQLHLRAAAWYEQNGVILEAIQHASIASDDEMVERLIEQHYIEMANRGEMAWVRYWTDKLSKEAIARRPWLSLYEALSCSWFGQLEEADFLLNEAEKRIRSSEKPADTQTLLGYLAYIKSRVTAMQGDTARAIELCQTARQYVSSGNVGLQIDFSITLGYEYFLFGDFDNAEKMLHEMIRSGYGAGAINNPVAGYAILARMRGYQGRLHEADDFLQKAEHLLQDASGQFVGVNGLIEVGKAALLCERNDLEPARVHLEQGLEQLPLWGKADDSCLAYTTLARIQLAQGNQAEAAVSIEKAAHLLQTSGLFSEARSAVEAAQVRLWLAQGDLLAVERWVTTPDHRFNKNDPFGFEGELQHITQARASIARKKPDEAIQILSDLEETACSTGRVGRVIEILLLEALAFQEKGDILKAGQALSRCLALAEPERYARVFLDEGQPVQLLIARWLAHAATGATRDFAQYLLTQFDTKLQAGAAVQGKSIQPDQLVEPLSPREIEVLQLIAFGKTNQEIARQLIVSTGTVKAHTASIYRKLDVANRTEAAARARQLGILP